MSQAVPSSFGEPVPSVLLVPQKRRRGSTIGAMSGPGATDPLIGATFGGYRIDRRLGRGGMGVVYLADEPRSRAGVALKVLEADLADDDRFRADSCANRASRHRSTTPMSSRSTKRARPMAGCTWPCASSTAPTSRRCCGRARCASGDAIAILTGQVAAALDVAHARRSGPPRRQAGQHPHRRRTATCLSRGFRPDPADRGRRQRRRRSARSWARLTTSRRSRSAARPSPGRHDVYALGCVA